MNAFKNRDRCPLCDSEKRSLLRIVERRGNAYRVEECGQCGHAYISNILADTTAPAEGVPPSTRPRHYQIARLLKSLLSSKRDPLVLEIGCGYGDVGLLVRPWARFIGYEPSETCSAHALSRGLDIRTEYFSAGAVSEQADAVVLDNVLEHVEDPNALLAEAAGALAPGGVLIVIVPNRKDIRAVSRRWRDRYLWVPPDHINYFSRKDIVGLMRRQGLEVKSFGLRPLRAKDWKFLPRALAESVGLSLFGHNVYGIKKG